MFRLFRLIVWIVIILIIFAIIPSSFWDKLRPFINLEKFIKAIKLGFEKLAHLFKEATGIDLLNIGNRIKEFLGIDLDSVWQGFKNTLNQLWQKISEFAK
jgi:hypothetical protein